ncbi:MAG: hypothetical protein OEX09_08325 [Candidatus Bathyarchaeota archaeon]|nr:hypothetical protein [Candidatus Bathyarchaeota archaeon]
MTEEITVRCLNCLRRIPVKSKVKEVTCPRCKITYRVSWPQPDQAKIRGRA